MTTEAVGVLVSEEEAMTENSPERGTTSSETDKAASPAAAREQDLMPAEKQHRMKQVHGKGFQSKEAKDGDDTKEVVVQEGAVPKLTPKLSAAPEAPLAREFVPPAPMIPSVSSQQQHPTTPSRHTGYGSSVVQSVDPRDPKYQYQINWGPVQGYPSPRPPSDGFSPVQYHNYPYYVPSPRTSGGVPPSNEVMAPPSPYPFPGYYAPYHYPYPNYNYPYGSPAAAYSPPRPHCPSSPVKTSGYPYFPTWKHDPAKSGVVSPSGKTATILHPQSSAGVGVVNANEAPKPLAADNGVAQESVTDTFVDESETNEFTVNVERLKRYTKSAPPSKPKVSGRKVRKNQQSRQRAQQKRQKIEAIESKPSELRTEQEQAMLDRFHKDRDRKNNRSKDRAQEKKEEMERILAKPEAKRTKIEMAFLKQVQQARKRKNEGDRLRRVRLRQLGFSAKESKPGISARGPLPHHLAAQQQGSTNVQYPYSPGMEHYPTPSPYYAPTGYPPYHHPYPPVSYYGGLEQGAENPPSVPFDSTPSPPEYSEHMKTEETTVEKV